MGRSSIIMVLGFTMALMVKGFNLSNVSSEAFDNVVRYYNRAASHGLAASLANMGSQVIYRVPNAFPTWSNVSISGGRVNLRTIVAPPALYDSGKVMLISTSVYPYPVPADPKKAYYDTVIIVWGQSRFSKFAYYSSGEGSINWASKDTVYGPFHTQDKMTINGSPVFWGKVTNKGGMTTGQHPEFHNGYQTGIDIPMPSSFTPLKNAALTNGKYLHGKDVTITFDSTDTGYMIVKEGTSAAVRVNIKTYCPNGAMVIDSANVRVKGLFTGQLTIAVQASGKANKGKLYLDSSIVYKHDPLDKSKPPSDDMLGLCAEDSIVITENSNNDPNIKIQAALFSMNKGLGAENYDDGNTRGRINLLGGVSQKQRAAVGTLDSHGSVNSGYSKSYMYDDRMMVASPPYYPATGSYEILSWYER